jgi:hypothetical protein
MGYQSYKILLDQPSKEPALRFDVKAKGLEEIIVESDPQFAIGIFGDWGSGKTTLMKAIKRELEGTEAIPVEFSAWRYEREEHLIIPLLDAVRATLVRVSERDGGRDPVARRTAATVGKVLRSMAAGFSFNAGVPGAMSATFDANKALEAARVLWREDRDAKVPRSFYHASFMALEQAFEEFVGAEERRRMVVFVDDLDRCLPEGALEVLESMKLFFDLPGFVFVVGLDQSVVESIIDVKYREVREATEAGEGGEQIRVPSGSDYIKKLFQVPYPLSPIAAGELERFLASVYEEADLPDDQKQDIDGRVLGHLRYLVGDAEGAGGRRYSGVNPREIKRYINQYTMSMKDSEGFKPDVLLAIQTISFRRDWQPARLALLAYHEIFVDAVRRRIQTGDDGALAGLDEELRALPDSFFQYLTGPEPGHPLLDEQDLARYLYNGEVYRSTHGPQLLEAINAAGQLTNILRKEGGGPPTQAPLHELKERAASLHSLTSSLRPGPAQAALSRDVEEFLSEVANLNAQLDLPDAPAPPEWPPAFKELSAGISKRLRDMFFAADVGASLGSSGSKQVPR